MCHSDMGSKGTGRVVSGGADGALQNNATVHVIFVPLQILLGVGGMVTLVTIETGSTVDSLHVTFQPGLISKCLTTDLTCERLAIVLVPSVLL